MFTFWIEGCCYGWQWLRWDEDDWERVWTEGRFYLGKEDGGDGLVDDDCDKHDDNNCDDDCGGIRPAMFW